MSVKVYLVGDEDSPKTNSWLAMTNSIEEANRLMEEMGDTCSFKSITVKEKSDDNPKRS